MKFSYQYDEGRPKVEMEINNDSTLPDVIQSFEDFLLACGYRFEGHLDLVENYEEKEI